MSSIIDGHFNLNNHQYNITTSIGFEKKEHDDSFGD